MTGCSGGCRGGYINVCLAHLISEQLIYHDDSVALSYDAPQRAVFSGVMVL